MSMEIEEKTLAELVIQDQPTAKLEPDGSVTIETAKGTRVPFITEWLTGPQVAVAVGLTRQHVNKLMNDGLFKTLAAIGDRPRVESTTPLSRHFMFPVNRA